MSPSRSLTHIGTSLPPLLREAPAAPEAAVKSQSTLLRPQKSTGPPRAPPHECGLSRAQPSATTGQTSSRAERQPADPSTFWPALRARRDELRPTAGPRPLRHASRHPTPQLSQSSGTIPSCAPTDEVHPETPRKPASRRPLLHPPPTPRVRQQPRHGHPKRSASRANRTPDQAPRSELRVGRRPGVHAEIVAPPGRSDPAHLRGGLVHRQSVGCHRDPSVRQVLKPATQRPSEWACANGPHGRGRGPSGP